MERGNKSRKNAQFLEKKADSITSHAAQRGGPLPARIYSFGNNPARKWQSSKLQVP
tara:strand:- start:109365 stop:109532 length:168 start_codon:yes stop_codon:yes gene_type:complete